MYKNRRFSKDEIIFLRKNYLSMDTRSLADYLKRSKRSIDGILRRLNLKRYALRRWTSGEIEFIQNNQSKKLEWVASKLNRHTSVVSGKANQIGITFRKPAQWRVQGGYKCLRAGFKNRTTEWEHIKIMEQYLGRKLFKPECVHHINQIKTDNGIENLFLCRDRQHHKLIHTSLEKLMGELLRYKYIKFDSKQGIYKICKTDN